MKTTNQSANGPHDLQLQQQEHPRLAYLLSIYPAVSHTFFLNEITELRKLGFTIDVASINKPAWPNSNEINEPARDLAALQETFYLKALPPARVLLLVLTIMFTRPAVIFRGLNAAMRLQRWNLAASVYSLFYLAEALILGDWLRRRGHQHLHIHFGGPVATVGMLTSIAWQIPYSLMLHGPEEFYNVDQSYLSSKVAQARFVLCISDYCRSQIMKIAAPAHWGKLHVVRLGVDPKAFASNPAHQQNGPTEITCTGRLVAAKGHLILVAALAHLIQNGLSVRLRLIGDGPERAPIEAFVAEHKLQDLVIFEGALSHEATRQRLAQTDIFVLASFAEGLPIALMEAMAMEIPCVSTFVAGIPELIDDGINGLLVPASSTQALATALGSLVRDPALRQKLGAAGRARVLDRYHLQQNVAQLATVMRALLG